MDKVPYFHRQTVARSLTPFRSSIAKSAVSTSPLEAASSSATEDYMPGGFLFQTRNTAVIALSLRRWARTDFTRAGAGRGGQAFGRRCYRFSVMNQLHGSLVQVGPHFRPFASSSHVANGYLHPIVG